MNTTVCCDFWEATGHWRRERGGMWGRGIDRPPCLRKGYGPTTKANFKAILLGWGERAHEEILSLGVHLGF